MARYNKPFLPVHDQIGLLERRGMAIADRERAARYLERVGYYRLSGYWYPLRNSRDVREADGHFVRRVEDDFREGTSFDDVLALYVFDKKLRLLMLDAIERVEVALRTTIALAIGRIGPWAYRDSAYFGARFNHPEWLERLDRAIAESKEEFIRHFKQKYEESPVPIWIAVEVCDFGALSRLTAGMKGGSQSKVSEAFGIRRPDLFCSWIRMINFVRNVCAHHGRLWNRNLADFPRAPRPGDIPELDHLLAGTQMVGRPYSAAAILRFMLRSVSPGTTWGARFKAHTATFPDTALLDLARGGGFPPGWEGQDIWD